MEMHFAVDNRKRWFVKAAAVLPSFVSTFLFRLIFRLNVLFFKWSKTFSFLESKGLPLLWIMLRLNEHILRAREKITRSYRVDLLSLMVNAKMDNNMLVSNEKTS